MTSRTNAENAAAAETINYQIGRLSTIGGANSQRAAAQANVEGNAATRPAADKKAGGGGTAASVPNTPKAAPSGNSTTVQAAAASAGLPSTAIPTMAVPPNALFPGPRRAPVVASAPTPTPTKSVSVRLFGEHWVMPWSPNAAGFKESGLAYGRGIRRAFIGTTSGASIGGATGITVGAGIGVFFDGVGAFPGAAAGGLIGAGSGAEWGFVAAAFAKDDKEAAVGGLVAGLTAGATGGVAGGLAPASIIVNGAEAGIVEKAIVEGGAGSLGVQAVEGGLESVGGEAVETGLKEAGSSFRWSKLSGRTLTRWLESLETQAAQNPGAGRLSAEETRALLEELKAQGWKVPRGVEAGWKGGLHINIIGPSGGPNIHLPVPEGFVP